jgi:hypothetical protein
MIKKGIQRPQKSRKEAGSGAGSRAVIQIYGSADSEPKEKKYIGTVPGCLISFIA